MEGDSGGPGAVAALFAVAQDGVLALGKLQANLMLAAGVEFDFQEACVFFERVKATVFESGLLGAGGRRADDPHAAVAFVLADPVAALRLGWVDKSLDYRPIRLIYRSFAELFGEATG